MYYYKPQISPRDQADNRALKLVFKEHPAVGSKIAANLCFKLYERRINHKRVDRLRSINMINPHRKKKQRRPLKDIREYIDLPEVTKNNDLWAIDFMHSRSRDKFKYKIFNSVDVSSKEAVAMVLDKQIRTDDVVSILSKSIKQHGKPKGIICDNGSEFCSEVFEKWAEEKSIQIYYIEPGKPVQNCYIESFNSIVRRELLIPKRFSSIKDGRVKLRAWKKYYNGIRPHGSLNFESPLEYASRKCV